MELRYYFTHCVKGDDGGWVSRDMRYPLSTHFSVLDLNPAGGGGTVGSIPVLSLEKSMGRYDLKPLTRA